VLFSLIGLGLNLIFGVLRVVNFAHGEFMVLGAFAAWWLQRRLGLPVAWALPLVLALFSALGALLYVLLIKRLANSDDPENASLMVTFGVSLVLVAAMLGTFDAEGRSLAFKIEPAFVAFGPVIVPTVRLVAFALALLLAGGTAWFLYRTDLGKALRAVIMNREAVQIVGIDVDRMGMLACALGIGLAGVTGVVAALVFPAFSPVSGADYTLLGFVVIVLGGLGHPLGALAGGMLIGLVEQFAILWFNNTVALIVAFLVMIAALMLRPEGLVGRRAMR
jgi:branched-chain amino acid transport system permease protein